MPKIFNEFTQNSFGKGQTLYLASEVDTLITNTLSTASSTAQTKVDTALTTSVQTVTSGSTYTIQDAPGPIIVLINPTTLLPAFELKMPPNLKDGQSITIIFGGTLATLAPIVTTFSLAPNNTVTTGWSIYQQTLPDSPVGGDIVALRPITSLKKVFRIV